MPTKEELLEKAQALNTEKKYSEVIELLADDLLKERIDADLYAEKAQAHYRLNENDLCEKAVDKALVINPNQAKANNYKGNINLKLKKYPEAERYYKKAIDLNSNFHSPYLGLGSVYSIQKKYDDAIFYFDKAKELAPKDALPFLGLGNVYSDLNKDKKTIENYNKAIENYNKAIEFDSKFDLPYYNRALEYNTNNEYQNAIDDFKKYIEYTKSNYGVLLAQSEIEKLEKSIAIFEYGSIRQLVKEIKDILLLKGTVTHYTSLTAAKAMILDSSKFRLSECAFLNDPMEGRELFKFLGIQEAYTAKGEVNCPTSFAQKPFIGSFVSDAKYDDLTLWRMYGKENKEEAKGCSITIDSKKLRESLRDEVSSKSKIDIDQMVDDDFYFYRMVYITQNNKKYYFISENEDKKLNDCMEQLAEKVKNYKAKVEKESYIKDLRELLNSIAYLFKSAEYQYEHEIRMVVNGVGLEKNIISMNNQSKVYIKTVPINPIIQKITLGPKVERAEELAAAFYYKLDKQGLHPEIFISHLPFK